MASDIMTIREVGVALRQRGGYPFSSYWVNLVSGAFWGWRKGKGWVGRWWLPVDEAEARMAEWLSDDLNTIEGRKRIALASWQKTQDHNRRGHRHRAHSKWLRPVNKRIKEVNDLLRSMALEYLEKRTTYRETWPAINTRLSKELSDYRTEIYEEVADLKSDLEDSDYAEQARIWIKVRAARDRLNVKARQIGTALDEAIEADQARLKKHVSQAKANNKSLDAMKNSLRKRLEKELKTLHARVAKPNVSDEAIIERGTDERVLAEAEKSISYWQKKGAYGFLAEVAFACEVKVRNELRKKLKVVPEESHEEEESPKLPPVKLVWRKNHPFYEVYNTAGFLRIVAVDKPNDKRLKFFGGSPMGDLVIGALTIVEGRVTGRGDRWKVKVTQKEIDMLRLKE